MSEPVLVTAAARTPPVGARSAMGVKLLGSSHAVARTSVANGAANQLRLAAHDIRLLRFICSEERYGKNWAASGPSEQPRRPLPLVRLAVNCSARPPLADGLRRRRYRA